jgi:superfamily I DNA/RNA helicase
MHVEVEHIRSSSGVISRLFEHVSFFWLLADFCRTDDALCKALKQAPTSGNVKFDVLALDETQDMTDNFKDLVCYLLQDNPEAQVIVVGDERQHINEYRGSRVEYLTEASRFFKTKERGAARPWSSRTLLTSYRLTPASAEWVNAHVTNQMVALLRFETDENSGKWNYWWQFECTKHQTDLHLCTESG